MKTQIVLVVLAGAALLGCEKDKPPTPSGTASSAPAAMDHAKMGHAASASPTQPASSAVATGTKHDPPITPDKVPAGHWYCDMGGSVHYSQAEEGDGKCAVCSMQLLHKK